MNRGELVAYLDEYLRVATFEDYGPQGLQVEGRCEVTRITSSVDAALPALRAAAEAGSHFHLVHHGLFWGEPQRLVGVLGRRVRTLMQADANLYAVHLALDAHPEVGNNAVLARQLGIRVVDSWCRAKGNLIGVWGEAPTGLEFEPFVARVNQLLGGKARAAAHGPGVIRRVGIVSGGAADEIEAAAQLGIDTYVTGEESHGHYWDAAECGINVVFAGHYATEVVGVRALGEHLAARFGLPVEFLDYPTGL
jgi:dinuclear metal center YbgI/SA1388 family protein